MKLGKLTKIELREYWKHEATDFSRWLAEPDNLALLGDEIGIDLELVEIEAGVGRYSADILAREVNSGRKVIIENQLEATDHSHLGQILTYAAGVEAEFIIWIVREARDEHKKAVDWLNGRTDDKVNFFLIQIELWRIGDSDAAPKFVTISRPNDWSRTLQETTFSRQDRSETQNLQVEFWRGLREFAAKIGSPLKLQSPRARHWFNITIGRSDAHVTLTTLTTEKQVGCELYIPDSKPLFQTLLANQTVIEEEIGIGSLSWQELPKKKASRIRTYQSFDLKNDDREPIYQWLLETALKFRSAFSRKWLAPTTVNEEDEPVDSQPTAFEMEDPQES